MRATIQKCVDWRVRAQAIVAGVCLQILGWAGGAGGPADSMRRARPMVQPLPADGQRGALRDPNAAAGVVPREST